MAKVSPFDENAQPNFPLIKGHNGHPDNERCDKLAVAAANASKLE